MPNKNSKNQEEDDYEFVPPKWWECQWRRISCNQEDCPLCGRILKDRARHLAKGEDPDSMEAMVEDVMGSFEETHELIQKAAKEMDVDLDELDDDDYEPPPDPEKFPLWHEVKALRRVVYDTCEKAHAVGEAWVETEAAKDLTWYAGIISSKTYRQLINKWDADHGDEHTDVDYKYTQHVIEESIKIINQALNKILKDDCPSKFELKKIQQKINHLTPKILTIQDPVRFLKWK